MKNLVVVCSWKVKFLQVYFCFVYIIAFFSSCAEKSKRTSTNIIEPIVSYAKLDLYPYDTSFNRYLPDTSLVFSNDQSLDMYLKNKKKIIDSFRKVFQYDDSATKVAIIRTSEILFTDNMEYLEFKHFSNRQDDLGVMVLGKYSPYSRLISAKDRILRFNALPTSVKERDVGRKTISRLNYYAFTKNIGKTINGFYNRKLTTMNDTEITFDDILKEDTTRYRILVFGASWCFPCIMEERFIKYWYPQIDSSRIRIIGLSVDNDSQKWKEYVKREDFPWQMFLLSEDFAKNINNVLEIGKSIPVNILIDRRGEIIAQNTDIRKVLKQIPGLPVKDD